MANVKVNINVAEAYQRACERGAACGVVALRQVERGESTVAAHAMATRAIQELRNALHLLEEGIRAGHR